MLYDFHTHTFLSDGVLAPIELLRRAVVSGYTGIGVADHAGPGTMELCIGAARKDCELAAKHWGIIAVAGVELTHVPAASVAELARAAKQAGALFVVVHGESPVEPVEPGTNLAAARCPDVDIIAHPGHITAEAAAAAAANGIFLEITARQGHNRANGLVCQVGREAGAKFLINSDAHESADLFSREKAESVARGAGLSDDEALRALEGNPQELLRRIGATADRGQRA
ncbi:MAG: histidinol phosphate phosphatase domain-containing protein [Armatimonadota bacterium]|nr:MAG: histidinol phosphate phosphatase domain-containing protein [Armatimonadota bacterium]